MARAVAIVQARMGSSRLPGKVLMDIEGVPMLRRVVERTRRATTIHDTVVATTTDALDDEIAEYCRESGIHAIRGSTFDVLDRYHTAARQTRADIIVRITADCPLIDPILVDNAVQVLVGAPRPPASKRPVQPTAFDFVANRLPPPWRRTYPIGLDTEVCTFLALERAWTEAKRPADREHVMPYLYEGVNLVSEGAPQVTGTSLRGFRVALLNHQENLGAYRWTVDTANDLEFVRQVYRLLRQTPQFSWLEVLALVRRNPELVAINAGIRHKTLGETDERAPGAEST